MIGTLFVLFAVLFIACDVYETRKHAMEVNAAMRQSFFKTLYESGVADELARELEIQADGGDNAGEYVEFAIRECWRKADNEILR